MPKRFDGDRLHNKHGQRQPKYNFSASAPIFVPTTTLDASNIASTASTDPEVSDYSGSTVNGAQVLRERQEKIRQRKLESKRVDHLARVV